MAKSNQPPWGFFTFIVIVVMVISCVFVGTARRFFICNDKAAACYYDYHDKTPS